MLGIEGYRVVEEVYASTHSLIYRAQREADDHPVVLKIFNQERPSPERIAWFKREYEVLSTLNIPGVVAAYSLQHDRQRWMMVLEDFGGESLHRLRLAGTLDLDQALTIAIAIAEILGQVHQRYVMHKDVNPSNIVLNPATGQVKLIDFGISTVLSRETPTFRNPNVLEGTLPYISPEQTGRMNRDMDYRTDFYSFGATLYELLTGQPPFKGDDALELVHSHIAKLPIPPHVIKPGLPPAVAAIVLKLLAKNAEDRYHSAYGIVADLSECLRQWQTNGSIDPFPLAQYDSSETFQIPQKLYGRSSEVTQLLGAFYRVSDGGSELLLVSGYAGVGKSALVHELYKPITERRGFFVAGKFDQLQRAIPYSALIHALRSLVQQLLTESEEVIASWRANLLAALGPNGQVISDVIPEVALIIGPQPTPANLGASETQHRFRLVFQQFIKVWAQRDHPLVIFLDDLQWADGASLDLLDALMTAPDRKHLLIIAAYRDNEVSPSHPMMIAVSEIRRSGATVNEIVVAPLDLSHTAALIADTLHETPDAVQPLAALVHRKTQGNPFFLNAFLQSLYVGGLLTFEYPATGDGGNGRWRWDVARIEERGMTDNVVELLTDKLQTLPQAAQQVLQLAACIGNQFDLATLAVVSERSPTIVAADLWPAVAEGLVVPLGDAYKLTGSLPADMGLFDFGQQVRYTFAHDRVQQAVYSLIPDGERHAIHWRVGQLLLRNTPADKREERIFALVSQLNHGIDLLTAQAERTELATLNLIAVRRAKLSAAYGLAFTYARTGCELLPSDAWQRQYDLALALHTEAAETAYLSGDNASMARMITIVLREATSLLDKAKAYDVMIRVYRATDAASVAFDVLRQFGMTFPDEPGASDIVRGREEIEAALNGRSVAELADLPRMHDPAMLAVLHIMATSSIAVYAAAPRIFPLYVFKQVALSVIHGNAPQSPYSYALYGLILCGLLDDLDAGYAWGQLGLQLVDTLGATAFRAKTLFTAQVFINHWKTHAHETLALGRAAYQSGLETGDPEIVGLTVVGYAAYGYLSGKELVPLEREIAAYAEMAASLKDETSVYRLHIYQQATLNLLGQSDDPTLLRGTVYDVVPSLPYHIERHDGTSAFAVYLNQLILCYFFGNYVAAVEQADKAEEAVDLVIAQMVVPVFRLYDSLARLAVYADANESERSRILEKVDANQAKLRHWAAHAPMNHLHRWHLVEAERARVLHQHGEAREQYDEAIALAQRHDYCNDEALAHELAGRFYLARGHGQFAQVCLQNAHNAYRRWGALAKVRDIETRYGPFFAQVHTGTTAHLSTGGVSTSGRAVVSALDVTSVVKASQAISGEIVLQRLLETLMTIVIENAGAQRGCLLLEKQGSFALAALGTVNEEQAVVTQPDWPTAASETAEPPLPLSIINYVARTQENVVLHDATNEGPFTHDTYLMHAQPKSVLCAPLLNGGKLTGILYLENNLTAGAFTPDRLEVLKLLAAQTAISIENARLYATLEQSERKYRTLFEDSRDALFISGRAGEILDVNPACELLFGYSKAELLHMNTTDFYAVPEERRRLLQTIASEGAVRDFEATLRTANGSLIYGLVTATMREADDGTPIGFQGIIRDVTERRRIERERGQLLALQHELDVARHIQASLLPPAHVASPWLDVVCYNAPAREVGGDFYAYRTLETHFRQRFALALGDVTGKGVPAALLMAISMTSLQAIIPQSSDPGDLLMQLDQAIGRYTRTTRQNCALVYMDVEPAGDYGADILIRVANAGCVAPLIRRRNGAVEWIDVGGVPLGTTLSALSYQMMTSRLSSGDMVILTSDGVIEATNPNGEMFSFARLEAVVTEGPADSATAMLDHVRMAVDTFAAGGDPHDDVTIMVLRV